jgi:hypothetical protein
MKSDARQVQQAKGAVSFCRFVSFRSAKGDKLRQRLTFPLSWMDEFHAAGCVASIGSLLCFGRDPGKPSQCLYLQTAAGKKHPVAGIALRSLFSAHPVV